MILYHLFFFLPRKGFQFLWFQTLWPHQFLRAYETTFGTKDFSCPRCAEARMSLLLVHVVLAAMVQNEGVLLLMVQKSSTRLRLVVYPSIYYRVLYIPGGWPWDFFHPQYFETAYIWWDHSFKKGTFCPIFWPTNSLHCKKKFNKYTA